MESIDLKVQVRGETGKGPSRRYRQKGLIPAVFYGPTIDPVPLTIDFLEFKKAVKGREGENILINLTLEGENESVPKAAMIRDTQIEPVKQEIIHVDFQEINLQKRIEVSVPIILVGKAEGIKEGGILQQLVRELEIRCFPFEMPDHMEIDVSHLGIGESVHIRDISVEEGVKILSSLDKTIATVLSPKVEAEKVEEEAVEEVTPSAEEEEKKTPPEAG